MEKTIISLRIEQIANGFLVSARKTDGSYHEAETSTAYVATRGEVITRLRSLFDEAESLSLVDAKDEF